MMNGPSGAGAPANVSMDHVMSSRDLTLTPGDLTLTSGDLTLTSILGVTVTSHPVNAGQLLVNR